MEVVQNQGDAGRADQQAGLWLLPPGKIRLISCGPMAHVSDIKLIRTDTTVDLSQKAEKGMIFTAEKPNFVVPGVALESRGKWEIRAART